MSELVGAADVGAALEIANAHAHRRALGRLAFDVLCRQAEGQTFYSGTKFVDARAAEHEVEREQAETALGNFLSILERGASAPAERALVAAFAVVGLGDKLEEEDDQPSRLWRWISYADWLEVCSDYRVYPFVDELLEPAQAEALWSELSQVVVDAAAGREGAAPRIRAQNAARLSALSESTSTSAARALRKVIETLALDEPTRVLASRLGGDAEEQRPITLRLEGRVLRSTPSGLRGVIAWVSGWVLMRYLLRAAGRLLGFGGQAAIVLSGRKLQVSLRWTLLGRVIKEAEEIWPLSTLEGARWQLRRPTLHLAVGVVAASLGFIVGGLLLFDGLRSGSFVVILIAAIVALLGAGLDLGLDLALSHRRPRIRFSFYPRSRSAPLELCQVSAEDAEQFLRILRRTNVRTEG